MDHPSTRPLSRAWRRSWLRENAERSRGVGVEWRPVRETRSIGVAAPARSIAAGDRAAARRRRWGSLSPPTRNPLLRPRASRRGRSDGVEVVAVGPSRSDNIPARVQLDLPASGLRDPSVGALAGLSRPFGRPRRPVVVKPAMGPSGDALSTPSADPAGDGRFGAKKRRGPALASAQLASATRSSFRHWPAVSAPSAATVTPRPWRWPLRHSPS